MTPQTVETLMEDIEREDPLDFALLSIDEHDARQLMANHFCSINEALEAHGLGADERLEIMAAIAAHTMVENLLLNVDRLRNGPASAEFREWLGRHGIG